MKRNNSILTKKFYEKRLDAFISWDEIQEYMIKEYPKLINQVTACFTYSCVGNIYYILNQVNSNKDAKNYLRKIKIYTKKYNKNIINNSILTKSYKYRIKIFNLSEE